jgi:hypothetical protein
MRWMALGAVVVLVLVPACRRPARPRVEVDSYETNTWVGTTTSTAPPATVAPAVPASPPPAAAPPAPAPRPRGFEPAKPW